MSASQQAGRKQLLPSEPVLIPSLKGLLGASALVVGGIVGILRSSTPALYTIASGLQWFTMGSTFWATRTTLCHALDVTPHSPHSDRLLPSAVASSVSAAMMGGLIKGRRTILPALLVFSLLGYSTQRIYNYFDARHTASMLAPPEPKDGRPLLQRVAASKWIPVRYISDEEYVGMLKGQLGRVQKEIAGLDNEIGKVKGEVEEAERKEKEGGRNI
ncbi:MAG: hypothetical protein LQ351_006503 [Letrouitia transgressa]|nr:MAG: hypothetical protein LQ351_006503 [Letrouitia transgressa]